MAGFVRRFTFIPTLEVIRQIEGPVLIDLAPPDPATGAGTGTVLLVGEFEDGFFSTEEDAKGAVEVFGSEDFRAKFGDFGYEYAGVPYSNPSARKHLFECWNGSGFIKAFKLRAQRMLIARVDTSVGEVSFDFLACLTGGAGPFQLAVGQTLSITTDIGGPTPSDAVAAAVATAAGSGEAFASLVSGDSFGVKIDGGPQVTVTFSAADTTVAAVVARINAALGYVAAVDNATEVDISGIVAGTSGSVELIETTAGVLAKLGHSAGTTAGTGNVGNVNAVTAAEVVAIVNGTAALVALQVDASLDGDGNLRICNDVAASVSTLLIAAGTMATALGLTTGSTVTPASHAGGTIPAGTRLRASGTPGAEWVTMQTLDVPAASLGPVTVKVRPGLDDGTHASQALGTVNTVVDPPDFAAVIVNNAAALTAALTEPQMDNAYLAAFEATLNAAGPARDANFLLSARRSDAVVRDGRANVLKATECGLKARKFVTGDPLGTLASASLTNVAAFRSDRVFYTTKGLKIRIPQIAERGEAGGIGFTADGVITVRPDGSATTIMAIRPPEENPGQQTNLIDDFFEVSADGETLSVDTYKAWKAAGIMAPRVDPIAGTVFQSGVTSSLESGKTTAARRKIADFIQDTLVDVALPYTKLLSRQSRRDKLRGVIEQFLASLKSEQNPETQRIEDFAVDDSVNAGNTPAVLAQGVYFLQTTVRSLSSLDNIVIQTEIGENAVVNREL